MDDTQTDLPWKQWRFPLAELFFSLGVVSAGALSWWAFGLVFWHEQLGALLPALGFLLLFSALLLLFSFLVEKTILRWGVVLLSGILAFFFFAHGDLAGAAPAVFAILCFRLALVRFSAEALLLTKIRFSRIARAGVPWLFLGGGLLAASGIYLAPFGTTVAQTPLSRDFFDAIFDRYAPFIERTTGYQPDTTIDGLIAQIVPPRDVKAIDQIRDKYAELLDVPLKGSESVRDVLYFAALKRIDFVRATYSSYLPFALALSAFFTLQVLRPFFGMGIAVLATILALIFQFAGLVDIESVSKEQEVMHFSKARPKP